MTGRGAGPEYEMHRKNYVAGSEGQGSVHVTGFWHWKGCRAAFEQVIDHPDDLRRGDHAFGVNVAAEEVEHVAGYGDLNGLIATGKDGPKMYRFRRLYPPSETYGSHKCIALAQFDEGWDVLADRAW